MPTITRTRTLVQRLRPVAVALGVPTADLDAVLARAAARAGRVVDDHDIAITVPADLYEQLEVMAARVGVPVQVLAAQLVDTSGSRGATRRRGGGDGRGACPGQTSGSGQRDAQGAGGGADVTPALDSRMTGFGAGPCCRSTVAWSARREAQDFRALLLGALLPLAQRPKQKRHPEAEPPDLIDAVEHAVDARPDEDEGDHHGGEHEDAADEQPDGPEDVLRPECAGRGFSHPARVER
jgi:hypothetical protein